jgi:hypothetical protein
MFDFELNSNLSQLTITTNSENLDAVVIAINETIRIELEAQATGSDSVFDANLSKKELFDRYSYKRVKVRSNWYQHIFESRRK